MKVLVTGATGFIGNYVVKELLSRNIRVIATSANEMNAAAKSWFSQVKYVSLNYSDIKEEVDYYDFFGKPDKVIHLAWEGLPRYKEPFHLTGNLPNHIQLLGNLIKNGCRDLNIAGTCLEYGLTEGCLVETMPANPSVAYSQAKNLLRIKMEALASQYDVSFKWIRLFYMHGEGQSPNSIIPQLQTALRNGDKQFNMSAGDQIRDYLPVQTVAAYICDISLQTGVTGIVNCCSGTGITVKKLVQDYLDMTNQSIILNTGYYPYSDIEPFAFWGSTNKLNQIIQ